MQFAYLFVFLNCLLPFVWTGIAKFSGPGFRNDTPRAFLETLEGYRKRAHWAQLNHFEALPFHIFALFVAVQMETLQTQVITYATGAFLLFRILFGLFYIQNLASARSVVWFLGILTNCYLVLASIF